MLKLIIKGDAKKEVMLDKAKISFGRDGSNDVVLDSSVVSGFHA